MAESASTPGLCIHIALKPTFVLHKSFRKLYVECMSSFHLIQGVPSFASSITVFQMIHALLQCRLLISNAWRQHYLEYEVRKRPHALLCIYRTILDVGK